jgi:hypothetical protein
MLRILQVARDRNLNCIRSPCALIQNERRAVELRGNPKAPPVQTDRRDTGWIATVSNASRRRRLSLADGAFGASF